MGQERLQYRIEVDGADQGASAFKRFRTEMEATEKAGASATKGLGSVGSQFEALTGFVTKFGPAALGAAAGLATLGGAAIALGKRQIDLTVRLNETAQASQLNVERYQELIAWSNRAGVAQDVMTRAVIGFARESLQAKDGVGGLVARLKNLDAGFLQTVQHAGNVETALRQTIRWIASSSDETERARRAVATFGEEGTRLLPVLRQGEAGFEAAAQKAREFGQVVGEDVVRAGVHANENLATLGGYLSGGFTAALNGTMGLLDSFTGRLLSMGESMLKLLGLANSARASLPTLAGRATGEDVTALDDQIAQLRRSLSIASPSFSRGGPQIEMKIKALKAQRAAQLGILDKVSGPSRDVFDLNLAVPTPEQFAQSQRLNEGGGGGGGRGGGGGGVDKQVAALAKYNEKVADLRDKIEALRDPTKQASLESENMARELASAAKAAGLSSDESAKLVATYRQLTEAESDRTFQLQTLAPLQDKIAVLTGKMSEEQAALNDAVRGFPKEWTQAQRDEVTALTAQEMALEKAKASYSDFFDVLSATGADVFDALISGTRSVSDAFEGLGLSIAKSLAKATVEWAKQQFLVNVLGGGGVDASSPALGGLATGQIGPRTAGQSVLGTGTSALSALGISPSSLLSGLGGGASVLASSGTTLGLLGLGLGAAQSGGGFKLNGLSGGLLGLSAIRTALPFLINNTALGSQLGGAAFNALGSYGPTTAALLGVDASSPALGGLAAGQIGPQTAGQAAAQAGGGIASSLSSVISIVGALYSLYSSVSGGVATNKGFSKSTLGDTNANQNFTALQVGLGVAGTAVGAGVGAAAGAPFAGVTFGASVLIGAAVGAAVAQAISSAIATEVGKGVSSATRKGYTQKQLDQKVIQGLNNNLILSILNPSDAFVGKLGGPNLASIFGPSVTPDIEDIFDKLGAKRIAAYTGNSFQPDRRLTTLGQGTTKAQRQRIKPLLGDIEGLSALTQYLGGAGTGEGGERLTRLTAIIFNSLASFGKTTEQAAALINRAVRGFAHGNFFRAVQQETRARAFLGDGPGDAVRDVQDRAFGQALPGADLNTLRDVFRDVNAAPGRIRRRDRKASREATQQLLSDAFSGGDTTSLIGSFIGSAQESVTGALGSGLLKGGFGDLLTGVNRTLRRSSRRAQRTGDYSGLTDAVGEELSGLAKGVQALAPALESFKDQVFKLGITAKVATGDVSGASADIEARLAGKIGAVRGTRQLARDVRSRSAFAIAGPGFVGDYSQLDGLAEAASDAEANVRRSNPLLSFLLDSKGQTLNAADTKYLTDNIDVEKALPLLKEYSDARLSQLEAELSLARQLKTAFGQVHDAAEGVLDSIGVARGGRNAQLGLFSRDRGRFLDAIGRNDPKNPNTLLETVNRGSGLLSAGSQLFGPGSAQFAQLLDLVEPALKNVDSIALAGQKEAKDREDTAKANVEAFRKDFTPVLQFLTVASTGAITTAIADLGKLLDGDTGALRVLRDIAEKWNVKGYADGGSVMGGRTIMVGERGPELFVPGTAGTIVPNGGGGGVTVNVSVNGGGYDPDAVGRAVAEALRQKRGGRLVPELRRAIA